ncbi:MAG: NAD(+) synthase, partial [Nannocystaceae bacterium]|nr:NAD(+) synthase [Nannocystaceae bacterium]
MQGFARVAAAIPVCRVTDIDANVARTRSLWQRADAEGVQVVVFPELGLCGYTARDLLHDGHLLRRTQQALLSLAHDNAALSPLAIVGLPLRVGSGIFNVAAAVQGGRIVAVVPKSYLPNYREFEEARWFRPGTEVAPGSTVRLGGIDVPFGTDLVLEASDCPDLTVGIELCEDLWVHAPPSTAAISAGATVIANLSASNFTIGKAELRRLLARASSDRGKCAYIYVAAGPGESSTDLAFDADACVCENGRVAVQSQRFAREEQLVTVDVDLEALVRDRLSTNTFGDCSRDHARPFRRVGFSASEIKTPLRRVIPRHPFLPQNASDLGARCWEIFEIQTNALATRMRAIGSPKLVLGVSGGLDSTQAALVAAGALDLEGQPRDDLVCITMPGLGTTASTRGNAEALVVGLGGS